MAAEDGGSDGVAAGVVAGAVKVASGWGPRFGLVGDALSPQAANRKRPVASTAGRAVTWDNIRFAQVTGAEVAHSMDAKAGHGAER